MDALDAEGLGFVRYADFAAFFMDADPWFKTDSDLAERCHLVIVWEMVCVCLCVVETRRCGGKWL